MIEVYTRSQNDILYSRMKEFLDPKVFSFNQLRGYNKSEDCSNFLHEVIQSGKGWVVVLDEDCYIYRPESILDLIGYMIERGDDYAGMPDGGACSTRARSWVVCNPFFNILNAAQIRKKYSSKEEIDNTPLPDLEKNWFKEPDWIDQRKVHHNRISPFNGLYNWLFENFNPLYLRAKDYEDDEFSTILKDQEGREFCIHSWYSREYGKDPFQTKRIDKIYNYAKSEFDTHYNK